MTGWGSRPSIASVTGVALSSPRPLTRTGRPSASVSSAGRASGSTTAGEGAGSAPGHGPASSRGRSRSAVSSGSVRSVVAAGTHRYRSPGSRPPCHAGTRTARSPTSPVSRVTARAARSSAAERPPHRPSWSPSSPRTSSGDQPQEDDSPGQPARLTGPAVELPAHPLDHRRRRHPGRPVPGPFAPFAVFGLGGDHQPGAHAALGGERRRRARRRGACRRTPACRAAMTGSSKLCSTRRSAGGSAASAGRSSDPLARRWA